jgi:hypothetical protein
VHLDIPLATSQRERICFGHNFKYANWTEIKDFLNSVDFYHLFNNAESPAAAFESFYDVIYTCIELFVPCKRIATSSRSQHIKYPYSVQRLMGKKATAWRVFRAFRTQESLASYKKVARKCKTAIKQLTADYENRLISSGNLGAFYRYANKKFSFKSAVGPLHDEDGSLIVDPDHKVNLLQRAFVNYYTADNGCLPTAATKVSSQLSRVYFSPSLVRRAIKRLKVKTKGGPDGIPPIFFINCCDELSYPLSLFFTYSFENSILPNVWLKSFITPIFKKGNATDPTNYRPISLTATLCKIMEVIIKDQLVRYLVDKGLINKRQHAFIANHSTATNLLECINDWLVSIKSPDCTDVVYIDFSKAFDTVVISKLLFKLECYGITGLLLSWIRCFLSNRTQCVVLDHCFSSFSKVISGVPQGSVLGPILFLIYINDIDRVCCGNTHLQLFADDAKLYSSINVGEASVLLQRSLDNLCTWASEWQLTINISKCAVLSISSRVPATLHRYFIHGISIPHLDTSCVDLGVTFSHNLDFKDHINKIVSRARQRTCMLFRGFTSRNIDILMRAFIVYIRPVVEYNSVVWNPCTVHLIDILESVQRSFTKRIPSISKLTYAERLAHLNLDTLELRRLRFDLIFYYKVFNHLTSFDPQTVFGIYHPPACLRCNTSFIQKPAHMSNKTLATLFYRGIDAWNFLPADLRLSQSLLSFKRGLKNVELSSF